MMDIFELNNNNIFGYITIITLNYDQTKKAIQYWSDELPFSDLL